ncbi:MAG: aminodeoxychorismate synthase component I [Verrucomicrobia bacterium]|nr:aminodeoxychorismate synthase component I [Verrucomicrobiota bacterium]
MSKSFKHAMLLDSHNYPDPYGKYERLAAFGAYRLLEAEKDAFDQLANFYEERPSWLFGHLSYDLKNDIEQLSSDHLKHFDFCQLCFFEPMHLLIQRRDSTDLEYWSTEKVKGIEDLMHLKAPTSPIMDHGNIRWSARQTKKQYIEAVNALKEEIRYGNIYEINYCQEFYQKEIELDPLSLAEDLSFNSPMPYGGYYKNGEDHLICASPERFLCKRARKVIAQPIKGTAKRVANKEEEIIKKRLKDDLKEQTENVMIVDLMRNDLSKTAAKGSVKVEELFGVYTFPQVYQLISTVSSELAEDKNFHELIKGAFPMGSMTGAPKISAMKLSEKYECFRRELYSGSIGYIEPNGDFDFNVVIRSMLYSSKSHYLSLAVGGAITDMADAEKEYEECLIKAEAVLKMQDQKE